MTEGRSITFALLDRLLQREFHAHPAPIIELLAAQTHDPLSVLVGTILSARTKDACTAGAIRRLLARSRGRILEWLRRAPIATIEQTIYPVGFYRDKARHLKALPAAVAALEPPVFARSVAEVRRLVKPDALVELLCTLPGVGRKTANLVVAVGYDLPAICVDTHVHRLSNLLGFVKTKTPLETEFALRQVLPRKYWKTWNSHLVSFGQTRCDPVHPKCEGCPLRRWCPRGAEVLVK